MPAALPSPHADLLRRLDELPISAHDRQAALAHARLAFGLVDGVFALIADVRALLAGPRRHAPRAS